MTITQMLLFAMPVAMAAGAAIGIGYAALQFILIGSGAHMLRLTRRLTYAGITLALAYWMLYPSDTLRGVPVGALLVCLPLVMLGLALTARPMLRPAARPERTAPH